MGGRGRRERRIRGGGRVEGYRRERNVNDDDDDDNESPSPCMYLCSTYNDAVRLILTSKG